MPVLACAQQDERRAARGRRVLALPSFFERVGPILFAATGGRHEHGKWSPLHDRSVSVRGVPS